MLKRRLHSSSDSDFVSQIPVNCSRISFFESVLVCATLFLISWFWARVNLQVIQLGLAWKPRIQYRAVKSESKRANTNLLAKSSAKLVGLWSMSIKAFCSCDEENGIFFVELFHTSPSRISHLYVAWSLETPNDLAELMHWHEYVLKWILVATLGMGRLDQISLGEGLHSELALVNKWGSKLYKYSAMWSLPKFFGSPCYDVEEITVQDLFPCSVGKTGPGPKL